MTDYIWQKGNDFEGQAETEKLYINHEVHEGHEENEGKESSCSSCPSWLNCHHSKAGQLDV